MLGKKGDRGVPYIRNIDVVGFSSSPGLVHHLGLQLRDALADDGVDSPDQGRDLL